MLPTTVSSPIPEAFSAGLSGTPEASSRRAALLKALDLPERLSPNDMLEVLNALYGYEGLVELGLLGKREELE